MNSIYSSVQKKPNKLKGKLDPNSFLDHEDQSILDNSYFLRHADWERFKFLFSSPF